jgi:hypothetical protein
MELAMFEDLSNVADNYGTRLSGYICVPVTGSYTFWIAGNDHAELSLSTDADPANKRRIAYFYGSTNPREWTKFARQQSAPINLVAGQRYYIEALHKEHVGVDHMAVGWRLPNGTLERPIAGNRLSPFESGRSATAMSARLNESHESQVETILDESQIESKEGIEIYPNPAKSGVINVTISGDQRPGEAEIQILSVTGNILYQNRIFCNGNCTTISIPLGEEFTAGIYMVKVFNGRRLFKRLIIK